MPQARALFARRFDPIQCACGEMVGAYRTDIYEIPVGPDQFKLTTGCVVIGDGGWLCASCRSVVARPVSGGFLISGLTDPEL